MRIIGGIHKGKRLQAPSGLPTRPTTDFAKEALFNILENQIEITSVDALDLFSGIGGISFELASRGVKSTVGVERNAKCVRFIQSTIKQLELDNYRILQADVFKYISKCKSTYDLIFCDPPYDLKEVNQLPDLVFENQLLKEEGILVIEHSAQISFNNHPNFVKHKKYSAVNFSFFE